MKLIKIAPYIPIFNGLSKYESYEYITTGEYSPGIEKEKAKEILKKYEKNMFENIKYLYCSDSIRGIETANLIKSFFNMDAKIVPNKSLNEIRFSLKSIVSRQEFEEYGSNIVRKNFIDAFINDLLLENRIQIRNRITILEKLDKENALFISHSFFMKILKIYHIDSNLFKYPETIRNHFNTEKKTFDFLELLEI